MAASKAELKGLSLMEKDKNGDVLWTWSFPTIDDNLRELIMSKSTLSAVGEEEEGQPEPLQFVFGHFDNLWYYMYNSFYENHAKVVAFCVVVLSNDFSPEKYHDFAEHLAAVYVDSNGSPPEMLSHYMSAFTKGWCVQGNEQFSLTDSAYDKRRGYIKSPLKDVVKVFGVESILIYVALLLKKRVVVFSPHLKALLKLTRALPLFVWHRQNWNILYPYTVMSDIDLGMFEGKSHYVLGSTDPSVESNIELYDLLINIPAGSVVPSPASKDSFAMGKVHKEIAMFMMSCAEDSEKTDQSFIKELSVRTRELINNLRTLALKASGSEEEDATVTLEMLQERKLTPTMENFLYSLASAEGLVEW